METKNKSSNRKQRNSNSTAQKMDCGPKYSKVSESLRYITSGSVQCSMFCGGRQCKYEGQAKWSESEMVIKGLYSSWYVYLFYV
jgi:protein tyrosine phosphatase domain-containing protein 1